MTSFLKLSIFALSLTIPLLLQFQMAFSFAVNDDDPEEYLLDNPIKGHLRPRKGRFLSDIIVKKGAHCDPKSKHNNACDGVSGNGGRSLVYCCKMQCQDILGDINNCGECGQKCRHGELCCNGVCNNVVSNAYHCGKCGNKCKAGIKCELGYCGYG